MPRKRIVWLVTPFALLLGAGALYWFAPWKLLTNTTVDDQLSLPSDQRSPTTPSTALPGSSTSAAVGPVVLALGSFVSHEHATTGAARIVRDADGARHLELVNLSTSDGPDLRVWLTDQPASAHDAFDKGQYLELGPLKGNRGNQTYPIPAETDLATYRSVTIWCIRFSVSFGAADLTPIGT